MHPIKVDDWNKISPTRMLNFDSREFIDRFAVAALPAASERERPLKLGAGSARPAPPTARLSVASLAPRAGGQSAASLSGGHSRPQPPLELELELAQPVADWSQPAGSETRFWSAGRLCAKLAARE